MSGTPAGAPLQGHDIICISTIDWDFIWQGHQQVMSTLARQGNRVLFIENTGVRAPGLRDLPRLRQRVRNWLRGTKGFRQEQERLFVYSPVVLPFPYSRLARWLNRWLLLTPLQRWMRAMRFQRPIVWTFLPTPLARAMIQALDPLLTVYYCIDDFASSSAGASRIRASEDALLRSADLVFVTSVKLQQRATQHSRAVHLFPFGVDFAGFERERLSANGLPADVARLPRPIIGYLGGLHQWLDQAAIAAVAERWPQASIVLVGPPQTDVSALQRLANVHLLGARSHTQVPAYVKSFDVGLVPYRSTAYTDHVYPTKLNEYLAMGVPVVARDLPEIRRFNEVHGGIVRMADSPEGFPGAVGRALEAPAQEAARRIEVARINSWDRRIDAMSGLMAAAIAERARGGESWREALLRLYRSGRRRAWRLAAAVVLLYAVIFNSPALWILARPLRMAASPPPVDVIAVFAGGVGESGQAGGGYQERIKTAIDLYHAGIAPRIIISSGYRFVFPEAEIMADLARAHGVPPQALWLEQQATDTRENVVYVTRLMRVHGWRSAALVSSPYHMRRATWTWRRAAPDLPVYPVPVPSSQFYAHGWGASLNQVRGILHEYAGMIYYFWRGWL